MTLLRDIRRSSKFLHLNLVLLAALPVALSMFLWPHWNENPDLSHGFFMPLLFLLLLHGSRSHGTIRFLPPHPIKTALTLLTIAAGLFIMGAAGLYAVTVGWSHTLVAFFLTSSACLFFFAGLLAFSDSRVGLLPLNWTSLVAIGLWLLCAPLPPGTYSRLTLLLQLSVTDHVLSALQLLRHAWHYGFTNESDQLFARFSINLNWDQLKDEPLMQEIFRNLKPLGL